MLTIFGLILGVLCFIVAGLGIWFLISRYRDDIYNLRGFVKHYIEEITYVILFIIIGTWILRACNILFKG